MGYPKELEPLAIEARKCKNLEEFIDAFENHLKFGIYWHITENPNFEIRPDIGPRDMSSMAIGEMYPGALMVTTDPEYWIEYYQKGAEEYGATPRPYAAMIDLSEVPEEEYWQVKRGFGNEIFVKDASKAKVIKVIPVEKALEEDEKYMTILGKYIGSREDLIKFYYEATSHQNRSQEAEQMKDEEMTDIWKDVMDEITEKDKEAVLKRAREIHNKLEEKLGNLEEIWPELKNVEQIPRFLKGEIIVAEKRLVDAEEEIEESITGSGKRLVVKVKGHTCEYTVTVPKGGLETCDCKDFQIRQERCKHIYAVFISLLTDYWKYDSTWEED